MADFNEREKAFEAKFKLDEELRFKATARRNRLLGVWAAEKMGLNESEADAYAKEVIKSDFEAPGDDDVLQKVLGDLQGKSIETSARDLRKHMDELMEVAVSQVQNEG
ncbi:MAG: DUF1476 family protein [Alphaproteobacteria bacterium]|nr:DUF1476 family protein [Alphaproteobacteria bacterium]